MNITDSQVAFALVDALIEEFGINGALKKAKELTSKFYASYESTGDRAYAKLSNINHIAANRISGMIMAAK